MSKLIKVTGLWLNETKDGNQMLSGKWGNELRVVVLKNTKKEEGSNQPDYNLFLAPSEQQQKAESELK